MSEREAFLAAICATPADDTPRLVFADWLDDHGEAERAEFIRVQVALAWWRADDAQRSLSPEGIVRHAQLRQRQIDLFHVTYHCGLSGPFVPSVDGSMGRDAPHAFFTRGFVVAITCTAADWLTHADAIRQEQPIERVRLTTWPQNPDEAAAFYREMHDEAGRPIWFQSVEEMLEYRWQGIAFELPRPSVPDLSPESFSRLAR